MKIFIQFSDLGYKIFHNFAIKIKEEIPNSEFYAEMPNKTFVKRHLFNQKKVKYNFFSRKELHLSETEINFELIKEFESKLPYKNIWQIISMDRGLGRSFLHGVRGYPNKFSSDRNLILKHFSHKLTEIDKMFKDINPDIFFPAVFMGSIETVMFDVLCRKYNIEYVVLNGLRFSNFCSFSSNYQLDFPLVENYAAKLVEGKNNNFSERTTSFYNNLKSDMSKSSYSEKKNAKLRKINLGTRYKRFYYIFVRSPLAIAHTSLSTLIRNFGVLLNKRLKLLDFLKLIIFEPYQRLLYLFQAYQISHPNFGQLLDKKQKYVFFPLQVQPEYANNVLAPMWMNTISVIETLAKSIPSDWVIYVKEHPAMLSDRLRSKNFYKKIKAIPNVIFAPTHQGTYDIIKNSQIVITSSYNAVTLDAIILNKPVIEFRKNYWSILNLSKKSSNFETLSIDVLNEIERLNKIPYEEKERRIKCLIESVLKYGFELQHFKQAFYNEIGSEDDQKKCGFDMADGFIKHLNHLKKEKVSIYEVV